MTTAARRRVERHLKQPYRIAVERGDELGRAGWVAHVDELPGCSATGDTPEQAEARVRAAMRRWFELAIAEGRDIPAPRATAAAPATASSHSGRLLLRMPSALHADLASAAEREGVSLNQLIVGLLSRSLAVSGEDGRGAAAIGSEPAAGARESRTLRLALAANLVVLVVAGAIAVVLLVVALTDAA